MRHTFKTLFTPLPFHPLYGALAGIISGIARASYGANWTVLCIAGLLAFVTLSAQPKFIMASILFSMGWLIGALRYQNQTHSFYAFHHNVDHIPCTLTARVVDHEPDDSSPGRTRLTLKVLSLSSERNMDLSEGASATIMCSLPPACTALTGDNITCTPVWFRVPENKDFCRYLIKEKCMGYIFPKPETLSHQSTSPPGISSKFFARIISWRNTILGRIRPHLSPETRTLFEMIFFGKKSVSRDEATTIRHNFKPWGILHQLARSGLHLVLLMMLIGFFTSYLPIPLSWRLFFMLITMGLYALISWSSISFIRAALGLSIYQCANIARLQSNTLYILALVCATVLIVNPYQLFFLDFQLSFSLTAGLAWLASLKKLPLKTLATPS